MLIDVLWGFAQFFMGVTVGILLAGFMAGARRDDGEEG